MALPVAVFAVFHMVSPILTRHDRRIFAVFMPAALLLYVAGVAFTYFVMLPVGVRFLLHFGDGVAVPTIRISEYMSLVMTLMFWLGVIFEIPLVMFAAVKLRAVSHERLKRLRRYLLLASPFLGIIITPTMDPLNMMLVSVPIIVLYEVGLFFAWLAEPGNGSLVMRRTTMLALEALRRLTVALLIVIPVLPVLYVFHLIGSLWTDLVHGDLATGTPIRTTSWIDRAYARMRWELAGLARLRRGG